MSTELEKDNGAITEYPRSLMYNVIYTCSIASIVNSMQVIADTLVITDEQLITILYMLPVHILVSSFYFGVIM